MEIKSRVQLRTVQAVVEQPLITHQLDCACAPSRRRWHLWIWQQPRSIGHLATFVPCCITWPCGQFGRLTFLGHASAASRRPNMKEAPTHAALAVWHRRHWHQHQRQRHPPQGCAYHTACPIRHVRGRPGREMRRGTKGPCTPRRMSCRLLLFLPRLT